MTPLVSVIMPVFNSESHLEEAVISIIGQTYRNFELILVDDGSNDKSLDIALRYVKRDARVKFFKRPRGYRKGGNVCRNYGFKMAKGKYINWFDSDDVMFPEMLEKKVEKIQGDSYSFVVSEGVEFKGLKSNTIKKWDQIESEQPLLDHAFGNISFHTNGPLFKKEFINQTDLFDENLSRKQEWEFYTRLLLLSPKYGVIKEPLFYYRNHGQSINGRNSDETLKSRFRADFLVLRTLLKIKGISKDKEFEIRRHFILKLVFKIKYAIRNRAYESVILGVYYLSRIIDFNSLKAGLLKVMEKPKVILNLLRLK